MKILRTFLLSLLVHSLTFPAIIFANTPSPAEEMNWIVKEYSAHTTYKDHVKWLNGIDAKRGHDLEEYLKTSGMNLNALAPSLSFSHGKINVSIEGKKFDFTVDSKNNVIVSYGKNSVVLNEQMSLDQVKTELSKLAGETKVSSLLNLIISPAQAQVAGPEILGAMVLVGLVFMAVIIIGGVYRLLHPNKNTGHDIKVITRAARDLCDQLSNKTPAELSSQKELVETHNKIQQAYEEICKENSKVEQCVSMRTARNCLSMAIEKAKSVNDSGRSNSKQVEYESPAVKTNSSKSSSK